MPQKGEPSLQPTAYATNAGATSVPNVGSVNDTKGNNNVAKKKKKGKTLKVVDGSVLGFVASGDPNRINAGEIDLST